MSYTPGIAPYYNKYSEGKNYSELLFRPGLILQNAELNEMQSILNNKIKRIGNTIMTDGDIIEGCELIVSNNADGTRNCLITAGKIYMNGDVFSTEDTNITITGEGIEKIGLKLNQAIITEVDDADLLDPSAGLGNYMQSGAHRLKTTVEFVIDDDTDESVAAVFTFENGVQLNAQSGGTDTTVLDKFNTTLARRTYDESGNYRVNGLSLVSKGISDDDNVFLTVDQGKAYILGWEVTKQTAVTIPIRRATDLRKVTAEPHVYINGTRMYKFYNKPVRNIIKLIATIQVTRDMTRSSIVNGSDPFPSELTPAKEIIEITQTTADGTVTYVKGTDYVMEGNTVKWLEGDNNEPESGTSYTCTWNYNKTMVEGVDFQLTTQDGDDYIELLEDGDTPVIGTEMDVDYNFLLYRRDIITMDADGNLHCIEGQPDVISTVESPMIENSNVLILGSVLSQPSNDEIIVINNNNTRVSMDDIHRILLRVEELEYNQAYTDLDNEAMSGEDASELKGVLTDGFIGFTKSDLGHVLYDAAIDDTNNELTLSAEDTLHALSIDTTHTFNPAASYKKYGRLITADGTESVLIEQSTATGVIRINSYAIFPNNPVVNLIPSVDNWVDESRVTITNTSTRTVRLRTWWLYKGSSWANSERNQWIALGFSNGGQNLGRGGTGTTTQYSYSTSVSESAILYMRQRSVKVEISKLEPYMNNVVVTFDGVKMNMTPLSSAYAGTMDGTLKADGSGAAIGTFTIPSGVKCGTKNVEAYPFNYSNLKGSAPYTANGRTRAVTTTVWKTIIRATAYDPDPIGQGFQLNNDQFITGVDLFFCIPGTKPVLVQIRGMENGYPNAVVYTEKVISPSDIKASTNGALATHVTFDDPVYCTADQQYCITVATDDNTCSLFYSQLGEKDVRTGAQIVRNPYISGTMFTSSNAKTWTAHQTDNLKFNIYGTTYEDEGYVYFDEIHNVSYDRLMLAADVSTPTNTDLTWEYSMDGGTVWYPITPFADIELGNIAQDIYVRAKFKTNNLTSPAINSETLSLVGFINAEECNYVSRNVTMTNKFYTVKQVVDIFAPSGTSVTMYYATDQIGETWQSATQDADNPPQVLDTAGWTRYTFKADIPSGASNFRARVQLVTNNRLVRPKVKNLMNVMK
jgi:hypothetical protein